MPIELVFVRQNVHDYLIVECTSHNYRYKIHSTVGNQLIKDTFKGYIRGLIAFEKSFLFFNLSLLSVVTDNCSKVNASKPVVRMDNWSNGQLLEWAIYRTNNYSNGQLFK